MRVAVTGGRDFDDDKAVHRALSRLPRHAVLVHGGARGADRKAAEWWAGRGRPVEEHKADWQRHGRGAGHIRNQRMVDSGIDMLVAFPGGRGTADMTRRAIKAGVPVVRVGDERPRLRRRYRD